MKIYYCKLVCKICMYISVSATCAISGVSGTNLTMAISEPKMIQMLRKLGYNVIHRCNLQICNQISQIDNNLIVIRCTYLIGSLIS